MVFFSVFWLMLINNSSDNSVMTLNSKRPKIPTIAFVSIHIDCNILQEKVGFY